MYLFCERLYEDVFSRFSFNDYYTEEQVAMTVRQLTAAIHWLHFRGFERDDTSKTSILQGCPSRYQSLQCHVSNEEELDCEAGRLP